jgi:hypothetical protein
MKDDTLELGLWIPGAMLRLGAVAVVACAVVILQPGIGWEVLAVLAALAGSIVPITGLGWIALAVIPFALILEPMELGRASLAVLTVHLGHVLATLSLTMPIRSRVSLRALRPTAVRFAVVQLVAQALMVAAVIFASEEGRVPWLAPVGALAVAGLALVLLRRVR